MEGYTFENFKADRRTVYATIRCLEIISRPRGVCQTSSRRVIRKSRGPTLQPPAASIANKYKDVADDMVWRTIQESLGPLFTAVDLELRRA